MSGDPNLTFIGAARTVTGSKTLLSAHKKKIMVDCGLFQGPRALREFNWSAFKDADKIDAIVLTHAHVDHCGYLPKLVREGFKGPIYCSHGTFDLCKIILLDSAHLQEEDARYANRTKHSAHDPALPLYRVQDALRALELFKPLDQAKWIELFPGISVQLLRSGHILGSSFVQFSIQKSQKSLIVTFSGDIGNGRQNVIKGPVKIQETDYLIMEGTYGDRVQPRQSPELKLEECINKIHKTGGVLVIPSFAVGRTQEILYLLRKLETENRIPDVPVFLDSPMATEATDIYLKHKEELKLRFQDGQLLDPICPKCFESVRSADESMALCMKDGPMVVVSAAGMLTGGRVLHHLKARLPKPNSIVLFVGWQAEQTKGRLLQQGLPKIRIHHQLIDVEAEILAIDCLSAHGDSNDIVDWISSIGHKPKKIFLNHGEEAALHTLQYRIRTELSLESDIPKPQETFVLK